MEKAYIKAKSNTELHKISKYIYSSFVEHFGTCIYDGIWVGKNSTIPNDGGLRIDTIEALEEIAPPCIRWPGGNFAEYYHWRDGIGSRNERPQRYNIEWGIPENNEFGTHEYMRFCNTIGSEPYIVLNVASGTVQEARDWVEYCNSEHDSEIVRLRKENGQAKPWNVKFWEVGNESWHSGGQMRVTDYIAAFRRYSNKLRMIGTGDRNQPSTIKLTACGSCLLYRDWDADFLRGMQEMPNMLHMVDYFSNHIYSGRNLQDADFSDEEYYRLLTELDILDTELARSTGLARAYSTEKHPIGVILGEWGTWYKDVWMTDDFHQKNTLRDAIFTAIAFHLFHNYADKLFMTNMSMMVNALQSLIQIYGLVAVTTPTYHVYKMFRPHRDGYLLSCDVKCPTFNAGDGKKRSVLSVSATKAEDGKSLFVSIVNVDLSRQIETDLDITEGFKVDKIEQEQLTSQDIRDYNSEKKPANVSSEKLPSIIFKENCLKLVIPPKSITTLKLCGEGEASFRSDDMGIHD